VGIIFICALLVYVGIYLFTKRSTLTEPIDVLRRIDSLKKENIKLLQVQKELDSMDKVYSVYIDLLDDKIDSINQKTIIIKEYYHDIIVKTKEYFPKEVDSFLKTRYKY
jgi:hypothetical protein